MFLKLSQNLQEKTCARVSFFIKLKASAINFIKEETLAEVFFCKFSQMLKNTIFTEHLRATASNIRYLKYPKVYLGLSKGVFRTLWHNLAVHYIRNKLHHRYLTGACKCLRYQSFSGIFLTFKKKLTMQAESYSNITKLILKKKEYINPLSTNPTKWSNTLKMKITPSNIVKIKNRKNSMFF